MPRYESAYRYKPPIIFRKWFQFIVFLLLSAVIGVGVAIYLHIRPFYLKAQEFDLDAISKLEKASIIYDRNRQEIGRIFVLNRDPVPLERIPRHMTDAVVATEDSRFYDHDGVDRMGILRATLRNLKDRSNTQGASTITQQLARNSFGIFEKSYKRKLIEAFLAMRIEKEFSKSEIMEMYLNRIYFGSGYYGVNAASKGYFGKEVSEIGVDEAAILAGLIRSPENLSPFKNPKAAERARNHVIGRMVEEGMITADAAKQFTAMPVKTRERGRDRKRAFEYAFERIRLKTVELVGPKDAYEGGFRIYTTIDSALQETAYQSLVKQLGKIEDNPTFEGQTYAQYEKILEQWDKQNVSEEEDQQQERKPPSPDYLQGAVIAIDNKTGGVRVLIGGRDYAHSAFDRAVQARRKPGTAFTPFVFAAGYAQRPAHHYPGSRVEDSPMDERKVMIGATTGILGEWGVESPANEQEGLITARRALAFGKNAATVRFGEEIGLSKVVDFAKRAGITFEGDIQNYNSTLLGNSEAGIGEMALAYTTFPNQGRRPKDFYIISAIFDEEGKKKFQHEIRNSDVEVCDPYTAYQIHGALQDVLREGTGKIAYEAHGLGDYPVAGKTGTAYGFRDEWFIGYTDQITCAVWAGFDKARTIYPGAFSNRTVLPAWVEVMNKANTIFPASALQPPIGAQKVTLCRVSGQPATERCFHFEEIDGEKRRIDDTFEDYLSPGLFVKEECVVHGADGQIDRTRLIPSTDQLLTSILPDNRPRRLGDYGRAVKPVVLQGRTVINYDPYASLQPPPRKATILKARVIGAAPDSSPESAPAQPETAMAPVAVPIRAVPIGQSPPGAQGAPESPASETSPVGPAAVLQPPPLPKTEDGLLPMLENVPKPTAVPVPAAARILFD
jgi:penicillin-binding protein 1A